MQLFIGELALREKLGESRYAEKMAQLESERAAERKGLRGWKVKLRALQVALGRRRALALAVRGARQLGHRLVLKELLVVLVDALQNLRCQ